MQSPEELIHAFPSTSVTFAKGEGGLTTCQINNQFGEAQVYLHGGHVSHFQPKEHEPVLWMSHQSQFESQCPIRGGIPICWPWFGPHPHNSNLPQHGFARTSSWKLRAVMDTEHSTELILGLTNSAETSQMVDWQFDARYRISVGKSLTVELGVTNTGSNTMQDVGCALHSYFQVSSIKETQVNGLRGKRFFDKLTGGHEVQSSPISITSETDRVYFGTTDPVEIVDSKRMISVTSIGSDSTVIWNPWIEKSKRMDDFPNEGYLEMICIETANAMEDIRRIEPGDTHVISQTVSAEHIQT